MSGPLHGSTVVEFAAYVTGPYAAMLLADMGARVIKVEAPGQGDPFRGAGEDKYSPIFCALNRGKESICLDLSVPAAQEVAQALASRADVFIENHRPGVAERMGLGYEQLRRRSPGLVYCSISGFGQDGPYRDRPGYDTIGQAMGGLLSLLTNPKAPKTVGISLADHLGGLFAAYGILGALVAKATTGVGQRVETSLLQATVSFIGGNAARYFASGEVPDGERPSRGSQAYAFVASDGLPFVIHLSTPQKFFEGLAKAIGRPELVADPRFAKASARVQQYEELRVLLAEAFGQKPRATWLKLLEEHDVPAAPLYTLPEVFNDPQVRHLGMETKVHHPERGEVRLAGSAVRLSATPITLEKPPPLLGEHTEALLWELGYGPEEVSWLRAVGAI